MADRTIFFIDDKNVYNGARRAFFAAAKPRSADGNYDPVKLAARVLGKVAADRPSRDLIEIRVYTGRPDPSRQRKAAAAHDRQVAAWRSSGVTVIERPLRYIGEQAQQKGVDVALAIDVVTMAIDGLYDIGVIASTDSDLRPPIEYVLEKCPRVRIEVTAWQSGQQRQRLSIAGRNVWCHWLHHDDYLAVADNTDYGRSAQ